MKKNLRMLCMGILAAVSAVSFAQTDVTSKLLNPDMEKGVLGWDVTFEGSDLWKKTTKNQSDQPSFHGCSNICLEVWRYNSGPMSNNTISQTVKELPNGTYVFGAYMIATNDERADVRDIIEGVSIFANDEATRVATNRAQSMDTIWAHTARFNVAAAVTDGTLKVGVKVNETNTNFTLMDNATLYYFGDMELSAALNEMAKIDIAKTLAIADTCLTNKMNSDTLALLNEVIEAAKALTTDAEFYTADENLYWGIRKAVKSIKDYNKLAAAIASAKEIASMEWTEYVAEDVEALNARIAEAEAMYESAEALRQDIDAIKKELTEAAAVVELDGIYGLLDEFSGKIDDMEISDEIGGYSEHMKEQARDLLAEVEEILADVEEGLSATEAKKNCETIFTQIQQILDNPITYAEFPITIGRSTTTMIEKYYLLDGAVTNSKSIATYTSKLYRFKEPLTKIRFTVIESGSNQLNGNYPFFTLAELEIYDEKGDKIELTEENVISNACHNTLNSSSDGQGIPGLLDGNNDTYFHSSWGTKINEHHYLEVTLPEDKEYYAFSFVMVGRHNTNLDINRQFPAVLDIRYVSDAINGLKDAIKEVDNMNPPQGNTPGFYNTDIQAYYDAVASAKELVEADYASDSEIKAAIDALYAAKETIEESFVMPDPEKKYRIVSGLKNFFTTQGVVKAMTIHTTDTVRPNWLWWETASPEADDQEFMFEPIPNDENKPYYAMKHAKSGLYVCDDGTAYGNNNQIIFSLAERVDTFELRSLNHGMFALVRDGNGNSMLHCLHHNSGNSTGKEMSGYPGSIGGETSAMICWSGAAYDASSWYIREMMELPYAAKSISELNFQSETISLYEGKNTFTFTADKVCAFADLKIYDILRNELVPTSVKILGKEAAVTLESNVETFSFTFTNAEGVETVTISGESNDNSIILTALQTAYNNAVAKAVVEGDAVGQVSDVTALNKALDDAEAILENGGTDEAILAATEAVNAAVAGLVYNLPQANKEYFIISGLDFRSAITTDAAIYAKDEAMAWFYIRLNDPAYRWKFIDYGEPINGNAAFYIQNVANELYVAPWVSNGTDMTLVDDTQETQPYNVLPLTAGKVSIGDSRGATGQYSLHPKGHNSGAGFSGNVILWGSTDVASAMYIVEAEKYISDINAELTGIENIDVTDEYVAPTVKGTFDLFGRRIDNPATTGIYIVDGVKVLIKK